jgi:hypothetical protein
MYGIPFFSGEDTLITEPSGAPPKGRRVKPPANAIFCIYPMRSDYGTWFFTDHEAGLQQEPFVGSINEMIDEMVKDIKGARDGFSLYFSATPIPQSQMSFTLVAESEHCGGADYHCDQLGITGWLCPALFCYFEKPPQKIYVRAEARR